MRADRLLWLVAALALLPGGCERRRGAETREADLRWAAWTGDVGEVQRLLSRPMRINATNSEGRTALHDAAHNGHLTVVQLLVARGADMDARDNKGRTPVMLAMQEDYREIVEFLVREGAGVTLHLAAYLGDVERTGDLIAEGANVNEIVGDGWTPLHCAISGNHREVVRLLIMSGADVNAGLVKTGLPRDPISRTALHRAVIGGHMDLAELLIDAGADMEARDKYGMPPLHTAARHGQLDMVKLLIARGADANSEARDNDFCGGTPIGIAIGEGHVDVAQALITGGADINTQDESGWTPLHVAVSSYYMTAVDAAMPRERPAPDAPEAEWDDYATEATEVRGRLVAQMVEMLIIHGANVNARDEEGITPMHCAAYHGLAGAVALLIAAGAEVEARTVPDPKPDRGVWENRDLGFRLGPGVTPLHEAAIGGRADVIELLIAGGADVTAMDESGATALHYAAASAQSDTVRLLITKGADVNVRSSEGRTPLHNALLWGWVETAKVLVGAGAEPVTMVNPPGRTLLHDALQRNDREWFGLLLANGADANERDEKGDTPLHLVVREGREALARLLLDHGADVNARNRHGITPLHCAAAAGRPGPVSLLLANGADVNACDSDGDTALHKAALRGYKGVVELLVSEGANVSLRDADGRTALDEAARRGHAGIVQLLAARMKDTGTSNQEANE